MKITVIFLYVLFALSPSFAQTEQVIMDGNNEIYIRTFGKGEPILIINGGPGMHSEGFIDLAKKFEKSNTAIIYDQRGTGKSKMSLIDSTTITLDLMIGDIETIRKHLNIEKWVILGHSFGGMLASYYATKHPDRIKGLILSSSGGVDMELFSSVDIIGRLSKIGQDSLSYWTNRIDAGDTTYYAKYQRGKFLAPAYLYDKSNVPIIARRLTQANQEVNSLVFKNMNAISFDCKTELAGFSKPVLIIQGEQDIVGKHIAQKAHEIFLNSEMVFLPKCGHYGWLDQPIMYFKKIEIFLNSLGM